MPLQIRRGTEAERQTLTSTNGLVTGELLYVTNTQKLYIGTGVTGDHKGVAITGYTNEDAQDAVGPMFENGTHNGIQFDYDDINNQVNATVNLSNYQGIIKADGFVGSVFADDSTVLVDGIQGRITAPVFGNVTGDVTGNVTGNLTGDVTGNVTGNLTGNVTGNLTGNVTGDVVGDFHGNLTGSLFSDNSTRIVDGATSYVYTENLNTPVITSAGALSVNSATNLQDIEAYADKVSVFTNSATNVFSLHPKFIFKGSKGTVSAPDAVALGDFVGGLQAEGWIGDRYQTLGGISIGTSTSTIGSAPFPGKITIYAKDDDTDFKGLVLDSSGLVSAEAFRSVGVTTTNLARLLTKAGSPAELAGAIVFDSTTTELKTYHATTGWGVVQTSNAPHQLPVYADDAARSAAIPTPTAGMMVFMTSGTAPAVTNKAVVYDSTAWVALH